MDRSLLHPSLQHNVFENQEVMQFPLENKFGIPSVKGTLTTGKRFVRFCDRKQVQDFSKCIAHFFYDDYKFISLWRYPDRYINELKKFKAVVSPDFSLYTDFPRALQILSCYRRNWCAAWWEYNGINVIPDVRWGDKASYKFCFEGLPKNTTVAVSTVGVFNAKDWNGKQGNMFLDGYNEMLDRLSPATILLYGNMIDGLEGNIIRIPSYYEIKYNAPRKRERAKRNGNRCK